MREKLFNPEWLEQEELKLGLWEALKPKCFQPL